jgi:hypothetical protein
MRDDDLRAPAGHAAVHVVTGSAARLWRSAICSAVRMSDPSATLGLVVGASLSPRAGRTLLEAMRADRYEALYVLYPERQAREMGYL